MLAVCFYFRFDYFVNISDGKLPCYRVTFSNVRTTFIFLFLKQRKQFHDTVKDAKEDFIQDGLLQWSFAVGKGNCTQQ